MFSLYQCKDQPLDSGMMTRAPFFRAVSDSCQRVKKLVRIGVHMYICPERNRKMNGLLHSEYRNLVLVEGKKGLQGGVVGGKGGDKMW